MRWLMVWAELHGRPGAQVRNDVEWLDEARPADCAPGRMLLADVSVSHTLTASAVSQQRSTAANWQSRKSMKYKCVAAHLGAEL